MEGNNFLKSLFKGLINLKLTDFLTNKKAKENEKTTLKEYDQYNTKSFSMNKTIINTTRSVLKNSIRLTKEKSLSDFIIEHKEK